MEVLFVKKLTKTCQGLSKATEQSAGFDIKSDEHIRIGAGGKGPVKTGLSIRVPEGTYGRIAPRSGLAVKEGIDVGAGVIDRDYTGEIKVVLFNHSDVDFVIKPGDRIAQLIITRISDPMVAEVNELPKTERGDRGFGSSGV